MLFVRLGTGIALIALLLWAGLLDLRVLAGALRHPLLLAAAAAALFGTLMVAALRWHVLLRVQGIDLPLGATTRVVLATSFFGTFLPGMLGGDLIRSGYIVHAARGRASTGLLSIVMDRALGLAGLLVVSAAVAVAYPADIPRVIGAAIAGSLIALLAGALALPRIARALARHPAHAGTWRAALGKAMRELNTALVTYRRAGGGVAAGLLLSVAICILDVLALLLVMRAMDIDALSWMQQALACTLALVANSLPLTPGGLGIGEAAFANTALALEPARTGAAYASAFLAYRCVIVLSTLPGAFVGIHVPHRKQR